MKVWTIQPIQIAIIQIRPEVKNNYYSNDTTRVISVVWQFSVLVIIC